MMELRINPFVANPTIMNSGMEVVNYLVKRPEVVKSKIVTDMGTGSGIIGIAAALLGADMVFMADIDENAVINASENITKHGLQNICEAFHSDLFLNYGNRPKSTVQIFNHPFFAAPPVPEKPWTKMMLAEADLLKNYFTAAPNYSTADTVYIMPWLVAAGNANGILDNDPGKQAPKHGYKIIEASEQEPVASGIQNSLFKMYKMEYRP